MSHVSRYACYGKDDFGHPYDALSRQDPDGEWVLHEEFEADRELRIKAWATTVAQKDEEIARLRAALSWISVGQGRAGWRGAAAHANEALASTARREVKP